MPVSQAGIRWVKFIVMPAYSITACMSAATDATLIKSDSYKVQPAASVNNLILTVLFLIL